MIVSLIIVVISGLFKASRQQIIKKETGQKTKKKMKRKKKRSKPNTLVTSLGRIRNKRKTIGEKEEKEKKKTNKNE